MKIINLHFLFLFLALQSIGHSQTQSETATRETASYSITYPSKSEFVEYENEENHLFKSLFSIYDFGNEAIADFSGISLSKLDCSGLGIKAVVEVTERGKTVVRSWNEHSQSAFDEVTYENEGFTCKAYLCKKRYSL